MTFSVYLIVETAMAGVYKCQTIRTCMINSLIKSWLFIYIKI